MRQPPMSCPVERHVPLSKSIGSHEPAYTISEVAIVIFHSMPDRTCAYAFVHQCSPRYLLVCNLTSIEGC